MIHERTPGTARSYELLRTIAAVLDVPLETFFEPAGGSVNGSTTSSETRRMAELTRSSTMGPCLDPKGTSPPGGVAFPATGKRTRPYIYRVARRDGDGTMRDAGPDRTIMAISPEEAITEAMCIVVDMTVDGANAAYLADRTGRILWALVSEGGVGSGPYAGA